MRGNRDPLANIGPLVRVVYAYAAFRLGPGADADDVTNDVFERALRYRAGYDPAKGTPASWLIGIARRCVDDSFRQPAQSLLGDEVRATGELESDSVRRLDLAEALERLSPRDRELIGLRYVVGLSTKEVAATLELTPGAVDVAVHRASERLRGELGRGGGGRISSGRSRPSASRA